MDKYGESIDGRKPIKLLPTRVWRTYLGGQLLDQMQGAEYPRDSHFPEEWIMSLISARNVGREHIPDEGLSRVDLPNRHITLKNLIDQRPKVLLGKNHVRAFGSNTGVLVKMIDSAERLTVQVHPDRERARSLFQSEYGKTECWHVLGGRTIDGEPPHVYLGLPRI